MAEPALSMPGWVLLMAEDANRRRAAQEEWERAGFEVEVVLSEQEALDFLAVMTPSLIVVDDTLYCPVRR